MRLTTLAATLVLGAAMQTATGAESEFQITPHIGQGELKVDAFENIDEDRREADTYGIGIGFGVLTPVGVLVEIGADSQGRLEWGNEDDDFQLTERYVALGYQFELGDGWRLTPKVGRSRWKLESDQGLFEFDDDEDQHLRGYEYVYELSLARRVSRVLALGLSYKQGDYDFGRARALSFMVQFGI